MKTFEITTPELRRAVENFDAATAGNVDGTEARVLVAAGNGRVRTVGQELKVRLAMPKIAAIEAKLIEGTAPAKQIEKAAA